MAFFKEIKQPHLESKKKLVGHPGTQCKDRHSCVQCVLIVYLWISNAVCCARKLFWSFLISVWLDTEAVPLVRAGIASSSYVGATQKGTATVNFVYCTKTKKIEADYKPLPCWHLASFDFSLSVHLSTFLSDVLMSVRLFIWLLCGWNLNVWPWRIFQTIFCTWRSSLFMPTVSTRRVP